MPLFEFVCKKCGTKFEKMVFSINKEEIECPDCKSKEVEKQFSTFSARASHTQGCSHATSSACAAKQSSGCCNGCCGHHH
jgi:putative FmdB family regulatory protein